MEHNDDRRAERERSVDSIVSICYIVSQGSERSRESERGRALIREWNEKWEIGDTVGLHQSG